MDIFFFWGGGGDQTRVMHSISFRALNTVCFYCFLHTQNRVFLVFLKIGSTEFIYYYYLALLYKIE